MNPKYEKLHYIDLGASLRKFNDVIKSRSTTGWRTARESLIHIKLVQIQVVLILFSIVDIMHRRTRSFDQIEGMSNQRWSNFIYKIIKPSEQSLCVIYCELSSRCQFYVVASNSCFLGDCAVTNTTFDMSDNIEGDVFTKKSKYPKI